MTDRELLARIAASAGQKAGYKQLVRELSLGGGRERRLLLEHLARLTVAGKLIQLDREHWSLPRAASRPAARENLVAGRLDLHRDGYGFVRPNRKPSPADSKTPPAAQDVFIPPNEINAAMQGDQVLVEVEPPKADGRQQGRIVRILERSNPTVVGTFRLARADRGQQQCRGSLRRPHDAARRHSSRRGNPNCRRILHAASCSGHWKYLHPKPESPEGLEGIVVDVEITSWPTPTRPPIGRVIEILGSPDDFGVDVEMMIRKHQLPRIFPEHVLAEARRVAHLDPVAARRADFRSLPIVTIDGETARDFDDAVLVREHAHGGVRASGPHRRRGRVRPPRLGPRSRSSPSRHQRLLPRSRHPHAAPGAFDGHLQPAPQRRPPCAELHHAARRRGPTSRASKSSKASSVPRRA